MTDLKIDRFGIVIKGENGAFYYRESDDAREINSILKSGVQVEKIIKPKTTPYNVEELLALTGGKLKETKEGNEKAEDLKTIDKLKKKWGL